MNNTTIRGRFAPSPSGRLHLGNMLSSLLAWLDVKSLGGEIIFRLEDLDPDRSHVEFSRLMAEDLEWMGLYWDIGWHTNSCREYAQSNRTDLYDAEFQKFKKQGLIYPCFCSRAQRLAASAPHPGEKQDAGCECLNLPENAIIEKRQNGRHSSYKIHVSDCHIAFNDSHCGLQNYTLRKGADDFIVRRADGIFSYQFAVSYDDAVMGITRVVRANDLLDSTPKQIWLIKEMGYQPPTYCHAPLLITANGRKMSKRDGDLCMRELRKNHTPELLCGKLAYIAGLIDRPDPITPQELIPYFSWDKVPANAIMLPEQLFL